MDGHPDNLLFRHIFLDCAQLAGIAIDSPEVDSERVYAMGGSQGGLLVGALINPVILNEEREPLSTIVAIAADTRRSSALECVTGK